MSPTPKGSSEERVRNLLFLSTPRLWPVHPFLPLIRRKEGGEEDCGVLYDLFGLKGVTGYGATVFLVLCGDPHKQSYAEVPVMQS